MDVEVRSDQRSGVRSVEVEGQVSRPETVPSQEGDSSTAVSAAKLS